MRPHEYLMQLFTCIPFGNELDREQLQTLENSTMGNKPKMTLNHLSFPTKDVVTEAKFFEEHLGAKLEFVHAPTGSALLKHGEIDIVLEPMKEDVPWHKDFHFGFELETKREVDALFETFKQSGVKLESEVFNRVGRGSRFFGRTPGGVQIEVN